MRIPKERRAALRFGNIKLIIALCGVVCLTTPVLADLTAGLLALGKQDYPTALREFTAAAEAGDAEAQYSLAQLYENGQGVLRDPDKILYWYRKSAQQGYDLAQNNLGFMYENGEGVPRDFVEALRWYRLSAEQGYAVAQYNLGSMYARGAGIAHDYIQAYLWTALASGQGDRGAADNMQILTRRMTATQIEAAQNLVSAWLQRHKELLKPEKPVDKPAADPIYRL